MSNLQRIVRELAAAIRAEHPDFARGTFASTSKKVLATLTELIVLSEINWTWGEPEDLGWGNVQHVGVCGPYKAVCIPDHVDGRYIVNVYTDETLVLVTHAATLVDAKALVERWRDAEEAA